MIVYSKLAVAQTEVPKYLGLFDSVLCQCHELGHPWDPSCIRTWRNIFIDGMKFSLKVYTPLYLLGAAFKLRKRNVDKKTLMKQTVIGILQSSLFLAMAGTWLMICFCAYGAIFGKYHGVFGYVIGFVSAFLSFIIERKSRRSLLAVFILNQALEAVFRMAVSRNYVTPVKNGEVYLFATTTMFYLSMFRAAKLPDGLQNIFSMILGRDEIQGNEGGHQLGGPQPHRFHFLAILDQKYKGLVAWLNTLGPKSQSCRHNGTCFGYTTSGALKFFAIGYGIEIVMQYRNIFQAISRGSFARLVQCFKRSSTAKFLCAYIALFRSSNCLLRFVFGCDHPAVFGAISGFVSGLSSIFSPSTSITMYALSKLLEVLCMKAVDLKWLPYFRHFDTFLYCISMSILFHCALLEPHSMRPSYWKFMCGLSGERFPLVFRRVLDRFGTQATKLYPNYIPNFDPSVVVSEEIKRTLAFFGKWPYALP